MAFSKSSSTPFPSDWEHKGELQFLQESFTRLNTQFNCLCHSCEDTRCFLLLTVLVIHNADLFNDGLRLLGLGRAGITQLDLQQNKKPNVAAKHFTLLTEVCSSFPQTRQTNL
jgi:hypothetical protein